jgi:hypothetical protein
VHWRKTLHLYSGAGITGAGYFPVYLLYVLYSMRLKGAFRTENELTYMHEKNNVVVFSASQRLFTGYIDSEKVCCYCSYIVREKRDSISCLTDLFTVSLLTFI